MYSVVVTDRSYAPQGEVRNVSSFSYSRALNKSATLSFTVRLDNAFVDRLSACDGYIKVYRNGSLLFFGPIVSAEESAESEQQTVAVTCADASWVLGHRICGRSSTGTIFATVTDRAAIAKFMIDAVNTVSETGLSTTTYTLTSGSAITFKYGPYANALAVLQELAGALDGFDWVVRPYDNWSNGALSFAKTGSIQASTVIGTTKPDAVFEYGVGTRSNVLSYSKAVTRDQQANVVYHLGSDSANVVTGTNAAAQTTWGWMDDVAQGEFTDTTMRQKLVDEHVLVRGNPRTLIRMTPHIDPGVTGRLPLPFTDYDVGDTITARFVHGRKIRFSGFLRVYGIHTTLDNGFERVELILEDDS